MMSVEDPNVIDAVGVNDETGTLDLLITDHLDWSDVQTHSRVLAAKLNAYVHAVESGQVVSAHPDAAGRQVCIDVIFKYPLTAVAIDYLEKVRKQLETAGIPIGYRVSGDQRTKS